jgi:hypothetical protein
MTVFKRVYEDLSNPSNILYLHDERCFHLKKNGESTWGIFFENTDYITLIETNEFDRSIEFVTAHMKDGIILQQDIASLTFPDYSIFILKEVWSCENDGSTKIDVGITDPGEVPKSEYAITAQKPNPWIGVKNTRDIFKDLKSEDKNEDQ